MPQLQPQFDDEVPTLVGVARVDGYSEVASNLGYGVLVVDAATAAVLIATGDWVDVTPS